LRKTSFRQPDPEIGTNNYGYKMLKLSRRPRIASRPQFYINPRPLDGGELGWG